MDPAGLTLSIITAFKEVYLVAKFMHRTIVSAKNHKTERKDLRLAFEYELLFLQCLGRVFLGGRGIVNDPQLDQRWLKHVHLILESMRVVCNDYSRIAAEDDAEYKQYSPYLNREMFDTDFIEFNIEEPLPTLPEPSFFSARALRWFGIKTNKKISDSLDSWKWALVERKKFEDVLASFQRLNGKLKDILPLFSATQAMDSTFSGNPYDEKVRRLGISRHLQLRQLSSGSTINASDILLRGHCLDANTDAGTVVVGSLSSTRSRSVPEKVLVEYKAYLPPASGIIPGSADIEPHRKPVYQLAGLLRSAGNDDLLTLPLRGVIEQDDQHRHAFVFDFPPDVHEANDPIPLSLLIDGKLIREKLSLFQRFGLAQQISKSIGAFHADGWVHKSIRSESVVFFRKKSSQNLEIQAPYLVNFEYSRPETAMSRHDFDNDLERNLYRHPDRQGRPKITFSKLHDLYALGVVLLEIGMWETAPHIFKRLHTKLRTNTISSPSGTQSMFIKYARQNLAHYMGEEYLKAVPSCLDGSFDDKTSRADFPMMFHEEVIQRLDGRNE